MTTLTNSEREQAVELAFELAKLGIARYTGRQLARHEEAHLLDELRALEAARVFKSSDELVSGEPV